MQQRFRKLALFIGAAALSGASVLVVACGTDNGTATPTPQVDGSKPVGDGGKPDGNVDPEKDAGGGDGGDGGVDCSKNPTLRDNTNGFRCAFKDRDAGGADASANCANTEECCNTESKATGPGYCATGKNGGDSLCVAQQPAGSTFNAGKGTVWECSDKFACAPTQICCMVQDAARLALDPKNKLNIGNTPPSQDANHPKACGVQYAYNAGGSRCKAPTGNNCPEALDIKLCSLKDNNCGAGTTCTPFIDFTNSVDRGFCK